MTPETIKKQLLLSISTQQSTQFILPNYQFFSISTKYNVAMKKKQLPKRSPLQKYSDVMDVGINHSTKSQLKKISQAETQIKKNKVKREQVPLVDLYMRVDGEWVHKGKSCGYCQILMNDKVVIDKHRYVCKVLNRKVWEKDNANP